MLVLDFDISAYCLEYIYQCDECLLIVFLLHILCCYMYCTLMNLYIRLFFLVNLYIRLFFLVNLYIRLFFQVNLYIRLFFLVNLYIRLFFLVNLYIRLFFLVNLYIRLFFSVYLCTCLTTFGSSFTVNLMFIFTF